jgi:TetR/AcrR family transcriptional repressor of nem operon
MGRKLAFDREKALRDAMEKFWSRGYEATSMRDLAHNLGLHLGSVYNALGTKEKVFEEALRLNFEVYQVPRLEKLKNAASPLEALTGMLDHAAEECTTPEKSLGCFIINSLHEITRINDSVTAFLHEYIRRKEEGVAACIARGQELGEIPRDREPDSLARFIVACVFSMRALSKMGLSEDRVHNVRDCALKAITG